ncbi:hypothetical protein B0H11DRAFT_1912825 [Mycena galericulata]|nr:hypothetical protein B0H11DRAFT_1912825 [Mycena galericulata]
MHHADFGVVSDNHGLPIGNTAFEGDFFGPAGEYGPADFGYVDSDGENDSRDDEDEDEDEDAGDTVDRETAYEPPRPCVELENEMVMDDAATLPKPTAPSKTAHKAAEDRFHHKPIVEHYPGKLAGKPTSSVRVTTAEELYQSTLTDSSASNNPYTPFESRMDWEVAKWVKLRGSGSTVFSDLLNVEGVRSSLGLSYGNSVQLNKIIDEKLPGRPKFTRSEVVVNGEVFHLYSRDILQCIHVLWGDTAFAPYLFVAPERHYIDKDKTVRMYHNMHTGKWWWSTQAAGVAGMPVTSGDGVTRRSHPICATFVGDYPEQCLATAVKTGECPTCEVPRDQLGEDTSFPLRDLERILDALDLLDEGPTIYARACADAGIKPVYHLTRSGKTSLTQTSSEPLAPTSFTNSIKVSSNPLFLG